MPAVVKIVPAANATPQAPGAFLPSVENAQQNQPLGVLLGDSIIWRNNTDDAHWPWPTDAGGNMLSEAQAQQDGVLLSAGDIPGGDVSDPIYQARPRAGRITIQYCCRHHPQERSSIVIS
jgi:hypothetical protein